MGILWLVKQQQQQQWLLRWLPRHLLLPSFGRHATSLRPFYNATIREGQRPQKSPPPPPQTPEAVHFIVDYLVSACGLSRTDAMKASKYLAHLKSPAKPDAVLRLLKETGLGESDIRRLVRLSPAILVADPKNTLEPKIKALRGAGFSGPEVAQLVSVNPHTLRLRNAVSKIEFWRKMVGDNKKLLKIVGNTHVLSCNLDCKVNPNLSFLRSVGMSDVDVVRIVLRRPRLVSSKLSRLMSSVEQVRSWGVLPGSGKFLEALSTICNLSQTTLDAKSKLLRSFGWSGDEVLHAFHSFPVVLRLSEKKLTRTMDFLVKEAACHPSYVAKRAVLLGYSLDRRLMPRYYALRFLKKKGLPGGDSDLLSVVLMPEQKFMEKFIAPVTQNVRELLEAYPEVNAMRNLL